MIEYIMRFDTDENGKLINARRMEKIVRCCNCENVEYDELFSDYWCNGRVVKPDGFCREGGKRSEQNV